MLCGKKTLNISLGGLVVLFLTAGGSAYSGQNTVTNEQNVSLYPDIEPPIITLKGDLVLKIKKGKPYVEQGAAAFDERDGNVSVEIHSTVDTNTIGTYSVTYTASDGVGNIAQITREVIVEMAVEISEYKFPFLRDDMIYAGKSIKRETL